MFNYLWKGFIFSKMLNASCSKDTIELFVAVFGISCSKVIVDIPYFSEQLKTYKPMTKSGNVLSFLWRVSLLHAYIEVSILLNLLNICPIINVYSDIKRGL